MYYLISEANLEPAVDEITQGIAEGGDVDDYVDQSIRTYGRPTYICPECGRLLIFVNGLEKPANSYLPENSFGKY